MRWSPRGLRWPPPTSSEIVAAIGPPAVFADVRLEEGNSVGLRNDGGDGGPRCQERAGANTHVVERVPKTGNG